MVNDKIKIVYAYDGLIYLPLLLAKELGYFPSNVSLEYVEGDRNALQRLIQSDKIDKELHCDFAICDPFTVKDIDQFLKSEKAQSKSKPIKVIGCLIKNPPFWLYKTNSNIPSVGSLSELLNNKNIRIVKGYEYPNTGYLYAKDLCRFFEKKGRRTDVQYEKTAFDPKKEIGISDQTLLITANVVKVAQEKKNNLIYTYATGEDEEFSYLRDILFTGIITRKEVIDQGLGLSIEILNAIRRAVKLVITQDQLLKEDNLFFSFFKPELNKYEHLKGYSDEQLKFIRDQILELLATCELYSEDLTFSKKQWQKMNMLRSENTDHKKFSSFLHSNSRIPTIIGQEWYKSVKKPQGDNWSRIVNLRIVRKILSISKFNNATIIYSLFIGVMVYLIEYKNRFQDWKYSLMTIAATFIVAFLIILSIRKSLYSKNEKKPLEAPHFVIFFVEVIVASFLVQHFYELYFPVT